MANNKEYNLILSDAEIRTIWAALIDYKRNAEEVARHPRFDGAKEAGEKCAVRAELLIRKINAMRNNGN